MAFAPYHYDVRPFRKVSYSQWNRLDYVGQSESGVLTGPRWPLGGQKSGSEDEKRSKRSAKCKMRRVDTFADHL
jgi:hypothetical protein